MPTQILATGVGAANSSDVVVSVGAPLTVSLKSGSAPRVGAALVYILLKDDAGAYWRVDVLTPSKPAVIVSGAGTYRFNRPASSASCGVFSA